MPNSQLDTDALFAALDAQRKAKELSWRQVAGEAGVSASTLTRLGQGKRPDVDSFAALIHWLGVPADQFLEGGPKTANKAETMAMVSACLRASKTLSPKSLNALEGIITAAYESLKDR
jgi:transcriptional regulator with XRE-family HTH domain